MNRRIGATVIVLSLLATVALIPGFLLLQSGKPADSGDLLLGAKGEPSSSWINDVPVHSGVGSDSSPTMTSDGDVLYTAFSRFDDATGFYRIAVMMSTDGGVTWSQAGDLSPGPNNCTYPAILVYFGSLYVAFQYEVSASDHDVYCYVSPTGGTGPWTSYGVRTDSNDDRLPAIGAVTESNYFGVYVVLENRRGGLEGSDLLMYRSTGAAFSFVNTIIGSGNSSEYTSPDITVYQEVNNPSIYVGFERSSGGQRDVCFVWSNNGGTTWSSLYQVAFALEDEYAPSISASQNFLLIAYLVWNGDPDLYVRVWNGVTFGSPYPLSASADYEGWPEVLNLQSDFYVIYARGTGYTNGNVFLQTATGAQNPVWSYPYLISDYAAAAEAGYSPGLALCDRPDANLYLAAVWGDYRTDPGSSDVYYSTQGCRFTVRAEPAGPTLMVDDVVYSSEQTFNWPAGYQHTLTASTDVNSFLYWDDGNARYYTLTIVPYATTSDVTMVAAYVGIPEFSGLVLPIAGVLAIFVAFKAIRKAGAGEG